MADNTIASAQIKVEAETSKAEQAIKDLRAKMDELGKSVDQLGDKQVAAGQKGAEFEKVTLSLADVKRSLRDVSDLMTVMARLEAPLRIAKQFFELGQEIEAISEKLLGLRDVTGEALGALADENKSPVAKMKAQLQGLQKELVDGGYSDQIARIYYKTFDALFGTSSETAFDQRFLKKIKDLQELVSRQQELGLKEQTEANRIATLEGVEKIEAQRTEAIRKAREKLNTMPGVDGTDYIRSINQRYDYEVKRQTEAEQRKTSTELDEIAKRRNAYDDLIREQQAKTIASNQKIADEAAKAMEKAFEKVSQGFNSLFDLRQLTQTLDALTANVDKIANQRRAAGL